MSLGNGNIHQKGEIPEITKLPNGRIRVIRRFQKFTREDVDNSSLGSLMGDFGAQDTADEQIAGQGYTNCRLIEVEVDSRFNALSNAENPILVKTYETLTETFVETTDPTVTFSESGLKEITKVYRAVSGTTNSNSVGTTTLDSGEILATSSIKDNTAFAELTEVYRQSGVINVIVGRDETQQTVTVECVGLSEIEVRSELMSLIGVFPEKDQSDFATTKISTRNVKGLEVQVYTFKINELTTLETTSDDLNFVRKIDLSGGNFIFGTINSTSLTFDSDTYTLRKEEVNNTGLIKKRTRIFALYDSDSFPENTLFEIDKTYGIAIPVARQIVPSSTATGTISATEAIQIEPVDSFRSLSYKILASDVNSNAYLPEQVWYEKRNVSIFPDELISAEIVGTESPVFVANYKEAPKVGLKAKITRKFSWGAPENSSTVISNNYQPQPFNKAIEVDVTRNSTSETDSNSSNNSTGTSASDSTSGNNTQSDSTGSSSSSSTSSGSVSTSGTNSSDSTSSGTSTSDSTSDSSSSGTSTSSTTNNSTGSSTNSSNNNSSSNSSGNSSVNTSGSSSSNNSSNTSASGSSSNTSSVNTSGSGQSTKSIQSDMIQDVQMVGNDNIEPGSTSSRTTRSRMDAVPNASDPARNVNVEAILAETYFSKSNNGTNVTSGTSSGDSTSTSNSTSSTDGTNNSSGQSTTDSSGSSSSSVNSNSSSNNSSNTNNTGNSNTTNNSSGNSTSTSSGTNNSSVGSTSTSSGTNTSSGISSGTSESDSTNSSEGTSTSSTNTVSSTTSNSQSTSQSTSNNSSNSDSTSKNTSKSIISINVKSSLREVKTVSFGSTTVTIPATTPATIARGSYIEIERSSSHWKYNIWVEQIVEVLLPSET